MDDVRGVSISKTIWGRLFGYASASIGTAATAGAEIHIVNVRGLDAILAKVDALRNPQTPAPKVAPSGGSRIVYDAAAHQYVKAQ